MAKKKRRRLKKSVRRGCALIIAVPILICLFVFGKDFINLKDFKEQKEEVVADEAPASLTTIRERIDHLFQIPQRLDTATISLEVYDIASRSVVYSRHANRLAPPASCLKLLTAVGAMDILGVNHCYTTQVVARGEQQGNTFRGTLTFQLDDDPMVETLQPMVDAIYRKGIRRIEGDIELYLMRDDTLKAHSTAATWDIPYNKLPILLKGRERIEKDLNYLLAAKGVSVVRCEVEHVDADENVIYRLETPLREVLAPMLIHSSNIKADGLYGHLHRTADHLPMFSLSEDWWVPILLNRVGGDHTGFVVNDGSGLSPDNRLTADFLVRLLAYAWEREDMRRVLLDEALATPAHPVRHGSLLGRMSAPLYRNRIFVKTGTLTTIGLSSLAGYAKTADGRWLIFSIINENSPVAESRIFQDALCREMVR